MKKVIIIIVCTIVFAMNSRSQNLFKYEHNQVTNNTYSLDLNLLEDRILKLNHYVVLWDMGEPKDTLGVLYKYIELGCSANIELLKNSLNTGLNFGFGNGNYHSGGGDFLLFESISFGADFYYKLATKMNLQLKGNATIHIRNGEGMRSLIDRYLWNLSVYYSLTNKIDLGLMYEQYVLTQEGYYGKNTFSKYLWLAPIFSVKLLENKIRIQSSLGIDLIDYIDTWVKESDKEVREFYKLELEYSL